MVRPLPVLLLAAFLAGCGATPAAPRVAQAVTANPAFTAQAASADAAPLTGEPLAPAYTAAASPAQAPAAPLAQAAAPVPFSVLTYNTWGKPGFLGTDLKRRFGLIGPAVGGRDVVALQETFTSRAGDLEETAGYPTFVRQTQGGFLKTNAGLTLLAAHPQLATEFVPFEQAAAGDWFARKGVLFLRVDVPGVGPVDLYDTHFQAKAGAKYDAIRQHDVAVLVKFVKAKAAGHPTFIMGDFNADPDSAPIAALKAALPLRDAYASVHPGQPGWTAGPDNPHRKPGSAGKRIDYVFVLDGDARTVRVDRAEVVLSEPIGGTVLSDHYALRADCVLLPR